LPLPFSPTKNVTGLAKVRSMPRENAGIVNGYVAGSIFSGSVRTF
jgi:hypothetical protein